MGAYYTFRVKLIHALKRKKNNKMWETKEDKSFARKKQRNKNNGWEREMDLDGLLEEKEEKRVNNESVIKKCKYVKKVWKRKWRKKER